MSEYAGERLANWEIRNIIQDALEKRPMTRYEIQKYTDICFETVKRHLQYLKDLSVVSTKKYKGKEVWVLVKHR